MYISKNDLLFVKMKNIKIYIHIIMQTKSKQTICHLVYQNSSCLSLDFHFVSVQCKISEEAIVEAPCSCFRTKPNSTGSHYLDYYYECIVNFYVNTCKIISQLNAQKWSNYMKMLP